MSLRWTVLNVAHEKDANKRAESTINNGIATTMMKRMRTMNKMTIVTKRSTIPSKSSEMRLSTPTLNLLSP